MGWTISEPRSVEELQETVKGSAKVRAVGSAHSFTPLVGGSDCGGGTTATPPTTLISLRRMPRVFELDRDARTVTVDAGATYSEVCATLSGSGYALPNTASLPHFGVAGAVATGTHGSSGMGDDGRLLLSGLPDAVASMELVGPDGSLRRVARGDPGFECSVVSLGMMGIVTRVELSLVDEFDVDQRVYGAWPPRGEQGSLGAMVESLPRILDGCLSFSLFVDWSVDAPGMLILRDPASDDGSTRQKSPDPEWFPTRPGLAPLLTEPVRSFIEGSDFDTTRRGPWHDLLHVWMRDAKPFGPQGAPELQFEHFFPLKYAQEALNRIHIIAEHWGGSLLYSEVRAVRADEQLLSPYSADAEDGYDTVGVTVGLHASLGEPRVLEAASVVEEALAEFRVRPHWGKLFAMQGPQIKDVYGKRLIKFREHRESIDPDRKFTNAWLDSRLLDA